MATHPRRHTAPLLISLLLATGCGSTAQMTADASGGTGTSTETSDGLGGAPGTSPTSGTTSIGGASGTSSTSGTTGSTVGSTTGTPGTSIGSTGGSTSGGISVGRTPGITATSVYVGFIYDKNAGAVNAAAGAGGITSGDHRANTNAVIKDINSRGGLGGRKLVAVWADADSTSTQTLDQQDAAVCERFTKDSPRVFAVDSALRESYRTCLGKAGVLMLNDGLPTAGQAELTRHPGLIEQGYPNVDRLASYYVSPLVSQGYFTPWDNMNARPAAAGAVKVGILTYDDKVFKKAVDSYLVPALKRLGYNPIVARIAQINTASDYTAQAAAVKSAQLTFATNGVTHVIPFESNGGLSTLFLPTARAQAYYPRYGVDTASASQALLDAGVAEPKQLNGAVGFGWMPAVDLPSDFNPDNGKYSNAERRHCLQVMKANGISFDSGNAQAIALNSCASLYLLKTVLDKLPSQVSLSSVLSTIESLGTSYQKAGGIGQEFRPGRHDPANKAYYWRYFAACSCLHYDGPIHTVP